jgi:hypothetical protein
MTPEYALLVLSVLCSVHMLFRAAISNPASWLWSIQLKVIPTVLAILTLANAYILYMGKP